MFAPAPHELASTVHHKHFLIIYSQVLAIQSRPWSHTTLSHHWHNFGTQLSYPLAVLLGNGLGVGSFVLQLSTNCAAFAGSVPEQHMHALLVEDKLAQAQSYVDWMTQLHKTVMAKA